MIPLTFGILGAIACTFLTYVFVQFRRELLHVRASSAPKAGLTLTGSFSRAPVFELASTPRRISGKQQTKDEAVMRKEILTSALLGAIGLLAPFIFVMLLTSR